MRGLITRRKLFGRKGMNFLVTPCLAILQYRNCFISFLRPNFGHRKSSRPFCGRFHPVRKSEFQRYKSRPYCDGSSQPNFDCDFPAEHWTRIRTNNAIERLNREIRRRTRVIGTFPDGNSALMLVCARLRYVAGTQWGDKRYMNMKHLEDISNCSAAD